MDQTPNVCVTPCFTADQIELVTKVRRYYALLNAGWFGGRHGVKEAQRRRTEISELRNRLGINKAQQTRLVNQFAMLTQA